MFTLRPTTPADLSPILTLLRAVWNDDEGAMAYHGGARYPGIVALEDGRMVGYAFVRRGNLHPKHTYVSVHVHPEERRRGIGTALWNAVTASVDGSLKTATYADQPGAVRFLERRGLRVSVETHQPTLNPGALNGAEMDRWVAAVNTLGYDLLPMTALNKVNARSEVARLHWDVYSYTHQHDPPAAGVLDEEDFLGDDLNPAWLWVARKDGLWAGVSSVRRIDRAGEGELGWFGVAQSFAQVGKALTLALTSLALKAAAGDRVWKVSAELDSADPNALHLLETLPRQRLAHVNLYRGRTAAQSRVRITPASAPAAPESV